MSAQTQQLSSNVPTQKIAMADYSIGMNNASSSFAVTNELVKMVDAGVKAKVYIDQTKQQYARLNLMEDWNKTDNDFKLLFAKAQTPEDQQEVIDNFSVSMQTRTDNYRKGGGLGLPTSDSLQSQRDLSSLRSSSQNLFSKMSITMAANINNRTNAMLDLKIAKSLKESTTNKNADPVSLLNTIKESLAKKVEIGGIIPQKAVFDLDVMTNKMIVGRGTLFAQDLAKEQAALGQPPSTPKEIREHIDEIMNFTLNDSQARILSEVVNSTYYKKINEFNTQENAIENFAWNKVEDSYITFKQSVKDQLMDDLLTKEEEEAILVKAKVFGNVKADSYGEIENLIRNFKSGDASKTHVDHFTTGEGFEDIRDIADNPDSNKADGYYDIAQVTKALENQAVIHGHEGMNTKTIAGIVNWFKKQNVELDTNRGKKIKNMSRGTLTAIVKSGKNPKIKEALENDTRFWSVVRGQTSVLNWESILSESPEFGGAWNTVQDFFETHRNNQTGIFSPSNMDRPANEWYAIANEAIERKLTQEFMQAIGISEIKKQDIAEKSAEKRATEDRKNQSIKAQEKFAEYKLLEKQGFFIPRKPPEIDEEEDAPPSWINTLDKFIGGDIELFQVDPQAIKESLYDSFNVSFIGSMANKKMRKDIEKDLGRSLTPDEIAGKNVVINKIAKKYMEALKESSPLGQIGLLANDVWHTIPFTGDYKTSKTEQYHDLVNDLVNESARRMEIGIQSYKPIEPTPDVLKAPDPSVEPRSVPEMAVTQQDKVGDLTNTDDKGQPMIPQYYSPPPIDPNISAQQQLVDSVAQIIPPIANAINPQTNLDAVGAMTSIIPTTDTEIPNIPTQVNPIGDVDATQLQPQAPTVDQERRNVVDPISPTIDVAEIELEKKFKEIERNTARWERAIELSQRAGWPMKDTKEWQDIQIQLENEFPGAVQLTGKGLSEPLIKGRSGFQRGGTAIPEGGTYFRDGGYFASIAAFLANRYNASSKKEQIEYANRAEDRMEQYYSDEITKKQKSNVAQMLSVLSKGKSSFQDDLDNINMPYDVFLEHMIGIYGAETNFGITKKVSKTDVVGELQVTRGTFRDVVKSKGNFGPLMAKELGYTIKRIRELAKEANDDKLRYLLLNNKKFNYLAGAAIMLNKLQYR